MPQAGSGPAISHGGAHDVGLFTEADLDRLTARAGLPPARRLEIRAAAAVLGFGVTSYVADELIDWSAAPDDPLYRLVFPDEGMLGESRISEVTGLLRQHAASGQVEAAAQRVRESTAAGSHPAAGERVLPGVYRRYHDTVSVHLPEGPAGGSFGITCPGREWPAAPGTGQAMTAADVPRLVSYLTADTEVTIVAVTGADPMTAETPALRRYIEPLLAVEHLVSIQLGTAALSRWPHRFLPGPDADDLLRLFEEVRAAGKTLAVRADFCHPRELEPGAAREAIRRIRGAGAVIYADGTLAGTVNDVPGVWAALWRAQARLGMIPATMTLKRVTGPGTQYGVPLARARQIFAAAYAGVSGLARTVRGPALHDHNGLLCLEGAADAGGQKVFVLRYIRARDPQLAGRPFFAAFDAGAAWLTDLKAAPGAWFPASP
jgi:L-lysine 2,3-aminomutase